MRLNEFTSKQIGAVGLAIFVLVFITEKGKIKSYDRTTITKVMVEEVE